MSNVWDQGLRVKRKVNSKNKRTYIYVRLSCNKKLTNQNSRRCNQIEDVKVEQLFSIFKVRPKN